MNNDTNIVIFIAIIGEQRELIVWRTFAGHNEADLHLSAYAAMDIIQEKLVIQHYSSTARDNAEPYLGFITPTLVGEEFYKIHAYSAATGFTVIGIFNDQDLHPTTIKRFFEKIHTLFAMTICNPLMSMRFQSPKFISEIDRIAATFTKSE
ncbi:Sedlin N-terminal conserved region family protein [Babesia bovis T2Bo]|uniref:Sedlin N-terminal conserved region family protein n=1 Tax=Babesia bovis T2Bo TaxID=484906 RepID=UPI001C35B20C|nr:Sedlin N-terminal conserved region family protein [Babesia bovis T2Bo]KAG6440160.1 Sedlin N-terminal conserved region family protein [Babesia bovis T2Bo]